MAGSIPASTIAKFTTFGDLLRFLRRRNGITQMELAIAVGYSDAQISRLEQNLRLPDIATIEARFIPALGLENEFDAGERLLELAANVRREDSPAPGLCPYKGLSYFDEADADFFVGREALTTRLAERVLTLAARRPVPETRFLAVVGASGSGKSSLVRAGLVPALRWNKKSADWHIHVLVPTARPLESLAVSLTLERESMTATARLMDDLAREPRSLHLYASQRLKLENGSQFLLVIDQFEELFALCRSEEERSQFIDNLMVAASEVNGLAIVVLTLRADFYASCANYPLLRAALAHNQEYIGAMSDEELRRAVEEPARRGRWEFEPGLVDLLLHDVGHEPGSLPLLSHALLETWQRRRGHTMTLSGYTSSGGVRGAIAETAEAVFSDQFTPEQKAIARRIFLRLTELGDEAAIGETRRRATFNELILRQEDAADTRAVLKTLADARLITTTEDSAEVAHEALIREWPTLRGWLEDNRDALRLHRRLTEAAQEWQAHDRDPDMLFRGARLVQAREWATRHDTDMNALERDFLAASSEASERDAAEREAQRQRELDAALRLAEVEKLHAEQHKVASQRLRRRAWILTALLALTGVLAVAAFGLSRQRDELAHLATSRELAAASVSNLEVDPERSLLLALEALSVTHTAEAEDALHRALLTSRVKLTLRGHEGVIGVALFSPDGSRIVTAGEDGAIRIWDAVDGRDILTLEGHEGPVYEVIYSPDGTHIASAGEDGTARLWNATSGVGERVFGDQEAAIVGLAFSPDGRQLATGSVDGSLILWDTVTGDQSLRVQAHDDVIISASFAPDGRQLATSSYDGKLVFWDVTTGQALATWEGDFDNLIFSENGERLLANFPEGAKMLEVATGTELVTTGGHTNLVFSAATNQDWTRIATAGLDRKVIVSDAGTGERLFTLSGHTGEILDVHFSPDGRNLVTAAADGTARLWNVDQPAEALTIATVEGYGRVAFSPDGTTLAAGDMEAIKVWEVEDGRQRLSLAMPTFTTGVAFDPHEQRLAGADEAGNVKIWNANSGDTELEFKAGDNIIHFLSFSPDGRQVATAGADGTVKVWDAADGSLLLDLRGHEGPVTVVAFSSDGGRLVSGSVDHSAVVWDARVGEQLFTIRDHTDTVWGVAFSPDGKLLATASRDGTAGIWDASGGQELHRLVGHTSTVTAVFFSPDGARLATASRDGLTKVWDTGSGQLLLNLYGDGQGMNSVTFSPDGNLLAAAGSFAVRVYLLPVQDLVALARTRVTRSLTEQECQNYLHLARCP